MPLMIDRKTSEISIDSGSTLGQHNNYEDKINDQKQKTKLERWITISKLDKPASKTRVTIQYPRTYFFHILFSVGHIATACLMFVESLFGARGASDVSRQGTFDFKFGLYSFTYKLVDDMKSDAKLLYSSDWQTYTYKIYCGALVEFQTRFSSSPIVDRDFFCYSGKWKRIQWFLIASFGCGIGYLFVLAGNKPRN
jgi:hypothetical protein